MFADFDPNNFQSYYNHVQVVGPHHFKKEYKEIYHLASYTGKYLFGTVIFSNFIKFTKIFVFLNSLIIYLDILEREKEKTNLSVLRTTKDSKDSKDSKVNKHSKSSSPINIICKNTSTKSQNQINNVPMDEKLTRVRTSSINEYVKKSALGSPKYNRSQTAQTGERIDKSECERTTERKATKENKDNKLGSPVNPLANINSGNKYIEKKERKNLESNKKNKSCCMIF